MRYKVDKKKKNEGLIEFMKESINDLEKTLKNFDVDKISEFDLNKMARDNKFDNHYTIEYGKLFEEHSSYSVMKSFKDNEELTPYVAEAGNMINQKIIEIQQKVKKFREQKGIEEPKPKIVQYVFMNGGQI